VGELVLSEEQVEALRMDRSLLQLFIAEGGMDRETVLCAVCLNVVEEVPGKS
jgi:hypothetical protein